MFQSIGLTIHPAGNKSDIELGPLYNIPKKRGSLYNKWKKCVAHKTKMREKEIGMH
jgi:hypothetical protein